jgi:peptide/nickel transport system substrate-binding protein
MMLAGVTVAGLALAACGSSGSGGSKTNSAPKTYPCDACTSVQNVSDKTGGVIKYGDSDVPDSFDPGNTYYAFVWDASRLWARALTTFAPEPGKPKLVPDLAASLGKPSDGGKTWTYTLRSGLKYSDGTAITSKDVKYAVERSNYARDVLSNGPSYFAATLIDNKPAYKGPYADKTGGLKSIDTPNDTTIIFHLKQPFADFDFLASNPQTAPVPQSKDTGADYVKHIVSSGSYAFQSYDPNKGAVLVKNKYWSASSDPIRKQYADQIDINFKQEQTGLDQDILKGNYTLDITGAGVAANPTQGQILTDKAKLANSDDAPSGALAYMAVSTKVGPLTNVDCRKAVEYAVDKVSTQNALGGPARGLIASTVMVPTVLGYTKFDQYPTPNFSGDVTKAKAALKKCGQPNGFSTNLSARADRPNEIAAAQAIQAALKKVNINASIQKYPSGKYFSDYAGAPAFVHSHNLGLMMMAWAADWPTGYGYLYSVASSASIVASGNTNLSELKDPKVDALLNQAITSTDETTRNKLYGEVDKQMMADAVIVPLTYRLDLLTRGTKATNLFVSQAYGMYDYLNIGTK